MSTRIAGGCVRISEKKKQLAEKVTNTLSRLHDHLLVYSTFSAINELHQRVVETGNGIEKFTWHINRVDYSFYDEVDTEPANAELMVRRSEQVEVHVKPAKILVKIPDLGVEAKSPGVAIRLADNPEVFTYAIPPPNLKSAIFVALNPHILDEIEASSGYGVGVVRMVKLALSAENELEVIMRRVKRTVEEAEGKLYYTPTARLELFPEIPPLSSFGIVDVPIYGDSDVIYYYQATFRVNDYSVEYRTKSDYGFELLLNFFLNEAGLRNTLEFVEKTAKAVSQALPLFLVVWNAQAFLE